MGHIRHNLIAVTGYDDEPIAVAHAKATELGLICSPIVEGETNSYSTFCVMPHGSKSGWEPQQRHEAARAAFRKWLVEQESASVYFEWAEFAYGSDDDSADVVASVCD